MGNENYQSDILSYLDFELEIGVGSGRQYPVTVLQSAAGEAREIMLFPFDDLALENRLQALQIALLHSGGKRRRIPLPEEQTVQLFGQSLFEALFIGEVRSRYAVSLREAHSQKMGLRLKLRIQPPALAALPWEFLYDPGQAEYMCLSSHTPIIRYLELPRPPQPLAIAPPLRVLGMVANPHNLADLDIEREQQRVERAIEPLCTSGSLTLTWLQGQTWQDLQRAMRRGPWHIFHFIGHGGFDKQMDEGLIAFTGDDGLAYYLSATQVGRLLADHHSLRLVVLNSCEGARGSQRDIFSSTAAILVQRGIPAVVAMQYEITDHAAIALSHAFYEAVTDGMPVDAAIGEARKAISLGIANTIEWGTPVLYMRSPNGVLFHVTQISSSSALPHVPRKTNSSDKLEKPLDSQMLPLSPSVPTRTSSQSNTITSQLQPRVTLFMPTSIWWIWLARGILAFFFGILTLTWSHLTVVVLIAFFGVYSLVDGIFAVVVSLKDRQLTSRWWVLLLEGIVGIAIGLLVFFLPSIATSLALLFVFTVWAFVTGIFEIASGSGWAIAVAGILSVLLSIVLFIAPMAGILSWLLGFYTIVFGVLLVVYAFQFRSKFLTK